MDKAVQKGSCRQNDRAGLYTSAVLQDDAGDVFAVLVEYKIVDHSLDKRQVGRFFQQALDG